MKQDFSTENRPLTPDDVKAELQNEKKGKKKRSSDRSHTIGAVQDATPKKQKLRKRTCSETRSSSLPLSSLVNDGCQTAYRAKSDNKIDQAGIDFTRVQPFTQPVPTYVAKKRIIKRDTSQGQHSPLSEKKAVPTAVKKNSLDEEEELRTRYHSPSPVKAISSTKQQHRRCVSRSASSSSCSSSTSLSCSESEYEHRSHSHHRIHRRHCHHRCSTHCTSCQTVVPPPPSTPMQNHQHQLNESPLPGVHHVAASPVACSSSTSYATVASHQRSRHPTQMAANFIPPPLASAVPSVAASGHHTCQQNSCLCLTFAQIWHSVLATHAAQASGSSGPSSCLYHGRVPTLTTPSSPSSCARHQHHSHSHKCHGSHRRKHRHSDVGHLTEELRTIGTQFPQQAFDISTQTPPMNSPQLTSRSAIGTMARQNSSAERSTDISNGPVAVIFDPQSHTSSDNTSPPSTAAGTPSAPIKSYFFTFRSMPNVTFLRSPAERRKHLQLGEKSDEKEQNQWSPISNRPGVIRESNGNQPPPPPRPPRNYRQRKIETQQGKGTVHHSSGDSGASLASYSVDTASLSRSPRFTEEESGFGGMQKEQQSPMEQFGRRLLLLPQTSSKKDSPTQEQKPTPMVRVQPCIAEEQQAGQGANALLSATVDLQSPSSALLHNRVTSSPDVVFINKQNKEQPMSSRQQPFLFNDENVGCPHGPANLNSNPLLRRDEEQAKERVRSLGNAVDEILHLFEPSTTTAPTPTNAFNAKRTSLHYVVYSALCPSLVHLLSHGFNSDVSLFSAVVEIITSGEVSEQSVTLVCQVSEMRLADSDEKKLLALFVGLLK